MSRHRIDRLQPYFLDRPELAVASLYLFGSRTLGRHWDRLLGLAVLMDPARHPEPGGRAELLSELAPELSRLIGEPRLDLLVLNDAPPLAGRRIVHEGRRLFSTDPALDRAYLRDVQVRAVDLEAFSRRASSRRPRPDRARLLAAVR